MKLWRMRITRKRDIHFILLKMKVYFRTFLDVCPLLFSILRKSFINVVCSDRIRNIYWCHIIYVMFILSRKKNLWNFLNKCICVNYVFFSLFIYRFAYKYVINILWYTLYKVIKNLKVIFLYYDVRDLHPSSSFIV